jgi:hypothetical protein
MVGAYFCLKLLSTPLTLAALPFGDKQAPKVGRIDMANLVHNERIKYAATFFNNLGVLSMGTGAIIPMFSLDERVRSSAPFFLAAGVVLGVFFLFSAYRLLGYLKE